MTSSSNASLYSQGSGTVPTSQFSTAPVITHRDPTSYDTKISLGNLSVGQVWINNLTNNSFILTNLSYVSGVLTATWSLLGQTIGSYPITPYVVGPSGKAGYQTIQSALDAANSNGGGVVYVQSGTYTENLSLYSSGS